MKSYNFILSLSILLMALISCSIPKDKVNKENDSHPSNETIISVNSIDKNNEDDKSEHGVLGREIIYRDNSFIKDLAHKSGIIVMTVCINRDGSVGWVEIDENETTIEERNVRKAALRSISKYKYEADPNAPLEECGTHKIKIDNAQG